MESTSNALEIPLICEAMENTGFSVVAVIPDGHQYHILAKKKWYRKASRIKYCQERNRLVYKEYGLRQTKRIVPFVSDDLRDRYPDLLKEVVRDAESQTA